MGMFDIDYDQLIQTLLPVRLRQVVQVAWLKCLVSPVKYLYGLFYANRKANLYNLAHDGQVCYLEAVLNDTFDNTLRRIFISDPQYDDPVYLYLVPEEKPVFIDMVSEIGMGVIPAPDPVPLYMDSELYAISGVEFIINVPNVLGLTAGQVVQLRALTDKYRLPSKRNYVIIYF